MVIVEVIHPIIVGLGTGVIQHGLNFRAAMGAGVVRLVSVYGGRQLSSMSWEMVSI